ncbi:MAG: metallopeptidase family protein [bacterium]|nr:metallopeptidase family protein [bacterium]
MISLSKEEFEQLVEQALLQLPEQFREKIAQENIVVLIEEYPDKRMRASIGHGDILGVFHGVARTEKSIDGFYYPDRIILYQKNIERICSTRKELEQQIIATVKHEVGHYFGLDEDELSDV